MKISELSEISIHPSTLQYALFRLKDKEEEGIIFIKSATTVRFCSYQQLYLQAICALYNLQRKGVKAGDEVLFQVSDNEHFLTFFWACILGGIVPVPVSQGTQSDHKLKLLKIWQHLRNGYLLCDDEKLERLADYAAGSESGTVLSEMKSKLILCKEMMISDGTTGDIYPVLPSDTAYIQYSSGSTGQPKGVILTHRNLMVNTADIASRSCITADDLMLSWMPLTHDMGLICFHLTGIYTGVRQCVLPTDLFIRRPLLWIDLAHRYRATLLYSPNFGFQYFLSAYERASVQWDLSNIRIIYNGAEHVSEDISNRFLDALERHQLKRSAMSPGYGLAEASVAVSLPDPNDGLRGHYVDRFSLEAGKPVKYLPVTHPNAIFFAEAGYPVANCEVSIFSDEDEVLPEGYMGHIHVRGGNVTAGYYNYSLSPLTVDGWLKTGDLGFFKNGRIIITGRSKNLIIINGQNYYPQDIERIAQSVNGIEAGKVVAVGIRNEVIQREELFVFVLFKGSAAEFMPYCSDIREKVAENLGLIVDKVIAIKKIPKTTSGKIQHYKLAAQYAEGLYDAQLEEISGLEGHEHADVYRIIEDISGLRLRESEDFLRAGLSSLQLGRLVSCLQQTTGTVITLADIFTHSTAGSLTAFLNERKSRKEDLGILAIAHQAHYELFHSQKRFWLSDQYHPGHSAYNLSFGYDIKGLLDTVALSKAVETLIARYTVLRTVFKKEEGIPVQQILTTIPGLFVDEIQYEDVVPSIAAAEANFSFNMEEGPLCRWRLIPLAKDRHVLFFTIHHIIADGWSIGLLHQEMELLYDAFAHHAADPLAVLHLQYADCIAWKQSYINKTLEEDRSYWLNELRDVQLLQLPAQHTSNHSLHEGGMNAFVLDETITRQLKEISHRNNSTLFMTLMAILNTLLYRYSGQTDICVGTDVAGRDHADLESQAGCFINTLCIRTLLQPEMSFTELVALVKEKMVGAFIHQSYPYDNLVSELRPGMDPLFNVLVLFQNFEHQSLKLTTDLVVDALPMPVSTSYTDLQFEFQEEHDTIVCNLRYDSTLYTAVQIKRMGEHLLRIVDSVITDPGQALQDIDFITAGEYAKFALWNDTYIARPEDKTVLSFIEDVALKYPASVAVRMNDECWSYEMLVNKVNSIAGCLQRDYDIKPGSRVGLKMERSPKMIAGLLGILKAGAAYVPIDPEYGEERIRFMLSDSGASLLYTDEIYNDRSTLHSVESGPGDLAYIMYTSGSTGKPKGVMVSHRALLDYTLTFRDYFRLTPEDLILQQASLSFDTSIEEIFPALCAGAGVCITAGGGRDVSEIVRVLAHYPVTVISTTPLVLNELNVLLNTPYSLRCIISGGDVLKSGYADRLLKRVPVYNTYGPTESTVCALYHPVRTSVDTGMLGRPIANRRIYILDDHLAVVPLGISGEICIAGDGLADGYINMPDETAVKFIAHPYEEGQLLYRSGDIGRWSEEGDVIFSGRKDQQIKIRGYRIEQGEIESVLMQYEGIEDVVVTVWGEASLVAFYMSAAPVDERELRILMADMLPLYMLPDHLIWLKEFPLLANGKVDRNEVLKNILLQERLYESPVTEVEVALAAIWEKVLSRVRLSVHDNFFESGGQSIKIMQIMDQVYLQLGVKLSFRDLFLYPTIKLLGEFVSGAAGEAFIEIAVAPVATYYPLSHVQQRFCILDQLETSSSAGNLLWVHRLEGHLSVEALEAALHTVVARHEILRTSFPFINGVQVQSIAAAVSIPLELKEAYHADELTQLIHEMERTHFDLESGPLIKAMLVLNGENDYVFMLGMHHIITDAWSMDLIADELVFMYNAQVQQSTDQLPAPKRQYKDYSYWHDGLISSGGMDAHRQYWAGQLAGELPVTELPTTYKRPAERTFTGGIKRTELTIPLSELAVVHQSGIFPVLLSAVSVLLFKYSGQTTHIIGMPVRGRTHPDLANISGCFINTVPIRIGLSAEVAFYSVVEAVKALLWEAQEHQDYPFDCIVEDLGNSSGENRSALFDVMVTYRNTAENKLLLQDLYGLQVSQILAENVSSQFDLSFDFTDHNGSVTLQLEYNNSLFSEDYINRLIQHFRQLLLSVAADSHIPVGELECLSSEEKTQLLYGFNNTAVQWEQDLLDMFASAVRRTPHAAAILCETGSLTYQQLEDQSNQLANYLWGVEKQSRIGLLVERNADTIVMILGILKAGAVYVPIDPEHPAERIGTMIINSGISLLLCNDIRAGADWSDQPYFRWWADVQKVMKGLPVSVPAYAANAGSPVYMLFTSGSTGTPKGVLISYGALTNYVSGFIRYFNVRAEDIVVQQTSLSFDTAVEEIFPVLCAGGKLVVLAAGGRDIERLSYSIQKYQVSILSATPLVLHELGRAGGDFSSLRIVISGGESLRENDIEGFRGKVALYNTYGPTETTVCATYHPITAANDNLSVIGRPVANASVYILDQQQHLQGIGIPGEICIGGSGVGIGYWQQEEQNLIKFIDNPYVAGERLYRTGDVGYWMADGNIVFAGRKDRQAKVRGYRIEAEEIEVQLQRCPGVNGAFVSIEADRNGNAQLVAYVVMQREHIFNESALRNNLADMLPSYMLPGYILAIPAFPVNVHGKIDRGSLPSAWHTNHYAAPSGKKERQLAAIFEDILEVSNLGRTDNFFESGGHSLKAMRIISRIYQTWNIRISIRDIFLYPSVSLLCERINSLKTEIFPDIPVLQTAAYYPLSFAQRRLWIADQVESEGALYHMSAVYDLKGNIDLDALRYALTGLVERHESLRTSFITIEGEPYQQIGDSFAFTVQDYRNKGMEEADAFIISYLQERFELEKGPLFKVCLLQLSDDLHLIVFNMHHIITDGWSSNILIREMALLYNAALNKSVYPLEALPIQYKDYADWQHRLLSGVQRTELREYWARQLQQPLPVLDFPADYARTAIRTFEGNAIEVELPLITSEKLRDFSKKFQVSLFMSLSAILNILLHKYTGAEDIITGTPVSGRNNQLLEEQVGLYVNAVVCRTYCTPSASFIDFLTHVKEVLLKAYEYQHYPFDLLVDELDMNTPRGRHPLFDIMVMMEDQDEALPELDGIIISSRRLERVISKYDLTCNFIDTGNELVLRMEYNVALMKEGTAILFAERFKHLLEQVMDDPGLPIAALSILLPEQQLDSRKTTDIFFNLDYIND